MFQRGRTNTITTIIVLLVTYFLNFVDYLQTICMVQNLGIEAELNPTVRFWYENNCMLPAKLIIGLVVVVLIGFITIKLEPRYICMAFGVCTVFVLVVWHNFAQLMKAGLLDLQLVAGQPLTTVAVTCFILAAVLGGVCGILLAYIKHLKWKLNK